MNKLDQTRKKNTESFLNSYRIQEKMRSVSGFDERQNQETNQIIQLHPQNPYDTNLQCGQIRLLSQLERITYVVLLRRWEEDSFVVMTFSHYDFPATDEEFKPQFDGGMYLNVLQAWNTRTLQDETLKKSWLIGVLPVSDCSDAWDLWNHLVTGCTISPELMGKTGLPVMDQNDLRIQYIKEELAVFDRIDDAEISEPSKSNTWFNKIELPQLWNEDEVALAAGDEKQDITLECTPYGYKEFVTIVYSPGERVLRVSIYTPDQSNPSHTFDSWEMISTECTPLAVIQNGFCIIHDLESFDGKCALRNPVDHKIIIFEKYQV